MRNLKRKEVSIVNTTLARASAVIASAATFLSALVPLASANTIDIIGNGAASSNSVNVTSNNSSSLTQSNNSSITNNVSSFGNSGGNSVSGNTGGDVFVSTGSVSNRVSIENGGNTNVASLGNCGCSGFNNFDVTIAGNGAFSRNFVRVNSSNRNSLSQRNNTNTYNNVRLWGDSGHNFVTNNTGGFTSLDTGGVFNSTSIINRGSMNRVY